MTDKKGIINILGKELEEILKNPETDELTNTLIGKAMEFGYTVGVCEKDFENRNNPYSAAKCLRRYENIKKLLKKS